MKAFLCCPIIDDPLYRQTIENVELRLNKAGHTVINPLKLFKPGAARARCFRRILRLMLSCEIIALTGNYRRSVNCQFILDIAFAINMKIANAQTLLLRNRTATAGK